MINWNDLRYLLATVQTGSYALAAEELGVNRTTVARRVQVLQSQLGDPLIESDANGYRLTEQGEQAIASAKRLNEEINQLELSLGHNRTQLTGSLRVAAPLGLGPEFMPQFCQFSATHPSIRLELINTQDPLGSINHRKADVALAVSHEMPTHIIGRPIATLRRAIYAADTYLAQHRASLDLADHRWIGWGKEMAHTEVAHWMQQHLPAETVVVARVNSWHALREAVSHGLGISHLWCFLADSMTGIQRIHPVSEELNVALWVCHHQDVTSNPRVSAFMQAMESSIRERM